MIRNTISRYVIAPQTQTSLTILNQILSNRRMQFPVTLQYIVLHLLTNCRGIHALYWEICGDCN